ncbi:MAG: TetR/AcrR family transcriptional regulator [Acidobacteriota bacterium]
MKTTKEELVEQFRISSIQDAAIRVIARKGLSAASMQEIATEAGIAKGTIYLYFENQQDLLERSVDDALSELLRKLTLALESAGEFRDRFALLVRTKVEFFDSNHDLFRVYLAIKHPEALDQDSRRCSYRERPQHKIYHEKLLRFIEEGITGGEIKQMKPSRVALFLEEGVVAVILQRLAEDSSPQASEDVDWIVDLILHGISKPC